MLDAHLIVQRPAFRLDIAVTAARGEVVALLGPNGAGKTTALRALAGLQATGGHIRLDGRDITALPAEKRSIGLVFQDYLLFPHLSALDNVAFGPRCRGVGKAQAARVAREWLDRVGLEGLHDRKPRALSGGQAQRVALARAMAVKPDLLLLDEPLAALDARTRAETRAALRHHLSYHDGATMLVTHDPLDALVLADRLVIVEDGAIVQEGPAFEITARPRTEYVARLAGLNLFRGRAQGHTVKISGEFSLTADEAHEGEVFVAFPPSAVALHPDQPSGSARNTWAATVAGLQPHGDHVRVRLTGPVETAADITPAAAAALRLEPGTSVWAAVKATETRSYPA
jgi:molybdate transport system ATP-binding protein